MKTILLVDDNRDFRENMSDILESRGYKIIQAGDGLDALDAMRCRTIDMVIMDICMPGADGVEIQKTMLEIAPDIPVILMSAYALDERKQIALKSGVHSVLSKPLSYESLFRQLTFMLTAGSSILIVEDDAEVAESLSAIFEQSGHKTVWAGDGFHAEQAARKNRFDFHIIDLKLPDISGIQVRELIESIRGRIKAAFITGFRSEFRGQFDSKRTDRPAELFEKPIQHELLLEWISHALESDQSSA